MNTEDRLKNLILSKHRSVREFTQKYDIPYSTMTTIFKRGINNANINNVIKICQALEISTDELIAGRITMVTEYETVPTKIEDIFVNVKQQLMNTDHLTLNDQPVQECTIKSIINSLDILIEIEKRNINEYLNSKKRNKK
jgi:DNA-binding Xre family transcriptional regulator